MKNNNKGFTLMEMLIVVAIIAILVAIAIPTFSNSLEKAREAADLANIRTAYAQVMADGMLETTTAPTGNKDIKYTYPSTAADASAANAAWTAVVTASQKQANWQTANVDVGGISVGASTTGWTVKYVPSTGAVTITAS